jgi:hypothetical protein
MWVTDSTRSGWVSTRRSSQPACSRASNRPRGTLYMRSGWQTATITPGLRSWCMAERM